MPGIQKLNQRHRLILRMYLKGMTNSQIADRLGMSRSALSVITNSASFQHEAAVKRGMFEEMDMNREVTSDAEVNDLIRRGAKAAAMRLLGGVLSSDESTAVKCSMDILDRAGHPRTQRVEQKSVTVHISAEDAQRIATADKESSLLHAGI